jgi:hypothetical protein
MRFRTAKKIRKRLSNDPSAALSYDHGQLQKVYREFDEEVPFEVKEARMLAARQRDSDRQKAAISAKHRREVKALREEMMAEQDSASGYEATTVPDLKGFCKRRGIKGYSSMTKPKLIEALNADDKASADDE